MAILGSETWLSWRPFESLMTALQGPVSGMQKPRRATGAGEVSVILTASRDHNGLASRIRSWSVKCTTAVEPAYSVDIEALIRDGFHLTAPDPFN